ncbi:UNVERIFIED_CONTAM: hypothetical protein RMT77_014656 [Armadillidium vulgare]
MSFENPAFHESEDVAANNGTNNAHSKIGEKSEVVKEVPIKTDMTYGVEDTPPWYLCIFLAFQHYMIMAGSMMGIPFILSSLFCIGEDDPAKGQLISTFLFSSGIITFLQTTFGVRLPIVQGSTFAFLIPTIAIITTSYPTCESYDFGNLTKFERDELWMVRMRDIQGAIMVSSLFQVIIGFTGAVGFLLNWISPLTIVPTITLVGLSLFKAAADKAAGQWGISMLTSVMLVVFSQHFANVGIPLPYFSQWKLKWKKFCIFSFFPVILAIFISWGFCAILTVSGALSSTSEARTDTTTKIINESPWFYVPYPFQWGRPTVSVSSVFGMLAGVISSMIESIGDYYACARLSGVQPPPKHAINRGIATEGIGCIIAAMLGTGNGTTSFSENIGALRVTRVASRRVIQVASIFMVVCGVFAKFGAVLGTLPDPVVGGIFMVMFGIIAAVGLSNLQSVDLNSSRNLFVLGISLFFGLSVPEWVEKNSDLIQTGSVITDQLIIVLLRTQMFVGGALGLILDNSIPGTDEERGLTKMNEEMSTTNYSLKCYDFPFGMNLLRKSKWCRKLPFLPVYQESTKSEL